MKKPLANISREPNRSEDCDNMRCKFISYASWQPRPTALPPLFCLLILRTSAKRCGTSLLRVLIGFISTW